jgi:hypothetical protein
MAINANNVIVHGTHVNPETLNKLGTDKPEKKLCLPKKEKAKPSLIVHGKSGYFYDMVFPDYHLKSHYKIDTSTHKHKKSAYVKEFVKE